MASYTDPHLRALGLGNNIFGPITRTPDAGLRSTAEGIIDPLVVYTRPKGASDVNVLRFLSAFTIFGRSEDDGSPSAWASWVISYIVIAFPTMRQNLASEGGREFKFSPIPAEFFHAVVEAVIAAESSDEASAAEQEFLAATRRIIAPSNLPELSDLSGMFAPEYAAGQTIPVVYGYLSLLVFLAGKKITERNSVTITQNRPQNLIDTYRIDDTAAYSLNGEGMMSSVAHGMINQVWTTWAPARVAIITEVAKFNGATSLAQRVVHTITKMLENSGMSQAFFISQFLNACPQIRNYSCMRAPLIAYAMSLQEVANQPRVVQPYYKLIKGDQTRVFHRNLVLPLAACAIKYATQVQRSLNNFELGEGAVRAVAMFDAEASSRGEPTLEGMASRLAADDQEEE